MIWPDGVPTASRLCSCLPRSKESRGSDAHFKDLDKEATDHIMGARIGVLCVHVCAHV
jgi:hypothetical protein